MRNEISKLNMECNIKNEQMKIVADNNKILDATVSVETIEGKRGIIFNSRGGAINSTSSRNIHYSLGVETILKRLKGNEVDIINIYINSSNSTKEWPNLKDRQLIVNDEIDISLSKYEPIELQRLIGSALANKKVNIESKGGNYTKKLFLTTQKNNVDWIKIIRPNNEILIDDKEDVVKTEPFDPKNIQEAYEKILVSITKRKGQKSFRTKLLKSYNNKCAVSKSNVVQILQAAHILPYRGEDTNHITNGIILRSDIHDLFDLNLISIDENYRIIVSPLLKETEYEKYHNQKITLPEKQEEYPSIEALRLRPVVYRE